MGSTTSRVVAGDEHTFAVVRHLRVEGGWNEIGGVLAREAADAFGFEPTQRDPGEVERWRRWYEEYWPQELARSEGAADALGIHPHDPRYLLTSLGGVPFAPACSALVSPAGTSVDRTTRIGRNFDTSIATLAELQGRAPAERELPVLSRPYVLELHPDEGRSHLTITGNTLSGCLEGINDAGLNVLVLAMHDGACSESAPAVALDQNMLGRFVLEHCSSAGEALQLLRGTPHYVRGEPLHWLICDDQGESFVWEPDGRGSGVATSGEGAALCVTNHSLARSASGLAGDVDGSRDRAASLARWTSSPLERWDLESALASVRRTADPGSPFYADGSRTLWFSMYETATRSVCASFYLGDAPDGGLVMSDLTTFSVG